MLSDILRVHLALGGLRVVAHHELERRRVRLGVPLISSEPEPLRSFEFPATWWRRFSGYGVPKGPFLWRRDRGEGATLKNNYSQFGFWGYGLGLASFGSCGCVGQ